MSFPNKWINLIQLSKLQNKCRRNSSESLSNQKREWMPRPNNKTCDLIPMNSRFYFQNLHLFMFKKALKTTLSLTTILGVGYFVVQREYDLDLGIYRRSQQLLRQIEPSYALGFDKFLCFRRLLWRNVNPQEQPVTLTQNLTIRNALGLASGYDNDGSLVEELQGLGFGFLEIGSVASTRSTRNTQDSNSYTLQGNAVKFENELPQFGVLRAKANLLDFKGKGTKLIPIGVSVMASEDIVTFAPQLILGDFENSIRDMTQVADYLVLNLAQSDRNRERYSTEINEKYELLQALLNNVKQWQLEEIGLQAAIQHEQKNKIIEQNAVSSHLQAIPLSNPFAVPVFVKIYSSANPKLIDLLQKAITDGKIEGVVFTKPCNESEQEYLQKMKKLKGQLKEKPIISVGGVNSRIIAQARLASGASACQILSDFVVKKGPYAITELLS